ncbi:MAG: acetolactate synthase small subunit [Campylobacteraceae bacterium 4484_4]|nr:MAG: acetolactate synthase small subunit [Campylobacteraceae bacterium 4484_4]
MKEVRKVISVIVHNEHGVLSRIAGLFAGRGYNIESLTVAPIPESEFSRFTIVTEGNEKVIEQITKQLHKLIPTYKVIEAQEVVEKEMALVKIPLESNLAGLDAILKGYNGSIANASENSLILMAVDDADRIGNFLKIIKKFHPTEIVRGGSVSMERT